MGREDLVPNEYDIVDKRVKVPAKFPDFKFTLRPSQKWVYDLVEDNSIINAWVSWGKTITALAIAKKLGQKTLIVT
ncbi:MAG: ATP-dependent helicase, partial [Acidobacteria bacterium]|nr:ATP-dependent helicase [Acidobacteriota bacterium]